MLMQTLSVTRRHSPAVNWDRLNNAAETDTGIRRSNNQDSYAVVRAATQEKWERFGHLLMVADGMGAHAVGELASKMACDNIPHIYIKAKQTDPREAIRQAYRNVNKQIHERAEANRDFHGMGTTCSTLILLPEGALIAHVGDSRVYRIRDNQIDQVSNDHSLLWELVQRNHLTLEQAQNVVPDNVITRSLGPEPTVEVDLEGPFEVQDDDIFVICSDGLSGPVSDMEIGLFASRFAPRDAARYLVHLANLRGGNDNITVIVARIGDGSEVDLGSSGQGSPGTRGRANGRKPKSASTKKPLGRFLTAIGLQSPRMEQVDANLYRSATCTLTPEIVDPLFNLAKQAQERGVSESWPLDWAKLAQQRLKVESARAENRLEETFRELGELTYRLGYAWRRSQKKSW